MEARVKQVGREILTPENDLEKNCCEVYKLQCDHGGGGREGKGLVALC